MNNPRSEFARQQAFRVRIDQVITAHDYSRNRLARETGYNLGSISRLMRGETSLRNRDMLDEICEAMGCTREETEDLIYLANFPLQEQIDAAIQRTTDNGLASIQPPQDDPPPRTDELPPVPPALMQRFQQR